MTPQGDDRPPEADGPPDEPERAEEPAPPAGPGDAAKPERPEKHEYTVYGSGKGDAEEGERRELPDKAKGAETDKPGEKPDYRVYRSRPSVRDRLGKKPDLASIRKGGDGGGGGIKGWLSRLGG